MHLSSENGVHLAALEEDRVDSLALSKPVPTLAICDLGAVNGFNATAGEVPELDHFVYTIAHAQHSWRKGKGDGG